MLEDGRRRGYTYLEPDLLIAAIATLADLIVVSRVGSDFAAAGVPVFDPWNWPSMPATRSWTLPTPTVPVPWPRRWH